MRIAFISRSTLHTVPGGDSIQVMQTAKHLGMLDVEVDLLLADQKINYSHYDAFHFFNLTRPADILRHLHHISKPVFLTPILVDYDEYDRLHRKGFSGKVLRMLSSDGKEYVKAIGRGLKGQDVFPRVSYLLKGQKLAIRSVLNKAKAVLPNSEAEYKDLVRKYPIEKEYAVIPNGIDPVVFREEFLTQRSAASAAFKENNQETGNILCIGRIEGIKNQLALIKALNNTKFRLTLIGKASPNQENYYRECKRIAGPNVKFIDHLPQEELVKYYLDADVHVLPSWFETCGLSSLEAAAMGCNIVVTDKGYAREYFGDDAYYCDPGDPHSILEAVRKATTTPLNSSTSHNPLQKRIFERYTWTEAARLTLSAYQKFLS